MPLDLHSRKLLSVAKAETCLAPLSFTTSKNDESTYIHLTGRVKARLLSKKSIDGVINRGMGMRAVEATRKEHACKQRPLKQQVGQLRLKI